MERPWSKTVDDLHRLLVDVSFRDGSGAEVGPGDGFARWAGMTSGVREQDRTVFLVGNGASASMASHMAADLAKNGDLHTEVFSDLSLITAISNDLGYENVFVVPLRRRCNPGDMLIAISSSGRSPNVLAAADLAREMGAMVVTLSAMGPDNPLRTKGDLNIYVAAGTYGAAETCHAALLHHWMDEVEAEAKRPA